VRRPTFSVLSLRHETQAGGEQLTGRWSVGAPLWKHLREDLLMTDERVRVLHLDRELAEGLAAADAASASASLSAPVRTLRPGPSQLDVQDRDGGAPGGLLVLEGCVSREVSVLGVTAAVDFLAHGDLLHLSDQRALFSVPSNSSWMVLEPTRLAVLDAAFVQALGEWPQVVANLMRRQERRADWLAHVLAISHLPRVELRVHVLFWLFADRWGHRRGNAVTVPIPLTHLNVARLIGAQRPTVTTAIRRLADDGLVTPEGPGHWILHGEPPTHLAVHHLLRD
jgi:CRP/FNR family cyclic AMP-dependent transcriptional regulator